MKKYATLKVGKEEAELIDPDNVTIYCFTMKKVEYIPEIARIFNTLSEKGWYFEFKMQKNNSFEWFMMSQNQLK